ncbi:ATP-binding cassette domain-containing protein [Streptomyces sp. NPDC047000]|uniref:ABC transporter ATP-binding protein n=1 Tax=Streptomyces sp. NPDC047000 TaxID=3155474 RepID=UPI0033C6E742
MIQAIGLTSNPRKDHPPAVDDVSFEAHPDHVTALLGAPGAGKTTALRLMLELQQGRGITYFRGRPLHRIAHPAREAGVLLGDVPGHPARTVRGHLRMLCAAVGVPSGRADEVLEETGLVSLRDQHLGTLSRGLDRRLGLACALLSDPHTLVLDDPAGGLCSREGRWLHERLRAHAEQGGTVLFSTADPKEAARTADRVVTLEQGRLVADQAVRDFARTRLRPRVAVRSPYAARLAAFLAKEARGERRSVEVVQEGGNRLSVYGSSCADIGETAFRHGILVHRLADEVGDMGPAAATEVPDRGAPGSTARPTRSAATAARPPAWVTTAPGAAEAPEAPRMPGAPQPAAGGERPSAETPWPSPSVDTMPVQDARAAAEATDPEAVDAEDTGRTGTVPRPASLPNPASLPRPADGPARDRLSPLPPPLSVRPAPGPLRPLRYELHRIAGVSTAYLTAAAVLAVSALTAVLLARAGHTPQARLFAAWPQEFPLPPAALGAGLLGALASGDEFRHPALAADRGTVPRRLGLLTAKLLVSTAVAVLLAVLTIGCDAELLYLLYGREVVEVPVDRFPLAASWLGLVAGCAWAGVLAAGVFRSTAAGLAAVVAVPVVVVPLLRKVIEGPNVRTAAGFPLRLRQLLLWRWPFGSERHLLAAARVVAQPVGAAMALSLAVLLCAYLLTTLRSRVR